MDDLTCAIGKLLNEECLKIVDKLCHLKMLDREEDMIDNCIPNITYFMELANEIIQKKKKKNNRRVLPPNEQCLGRKSNFVQCTRKRKDNTQFCGSHMKNLPNGYIGDNGECFKREKKKRGRKSKTVIENIGEDKILTKKEYINGKLYLVDNMNIVYHFMSIKNDNTNQYEDYPVIIGLLKDGKDGSEIVDFE